MCFSCCALRRPGAAATGALIGTATTNATGVATQSFAFTLPGNYTIVAAVSQADGTQYGLANASLAQVLVLDQTTLTLAQVRGRLRARWRASLPWPRTRDRSHSPEAAHVVVRPCRCAAMSE